MPKNSDPIFFPGVDKDLEMMRQRERNYQECQSILQTQWFQADLDQRFYLGDQDIWGQLYPTLNNVGRKMYNFNLIHSTIQMVSGHQRRNRKSTVVVPLIPEAQKTADQLTKCLYHVHNDANLYQIYSDTFESGALVQGAGFINFFIDHKNDLVSGDIKGRYVDFKSMIIDPYYRQTDLSDCRFIWTRQFFDKNEAIKIYKKFADQIAEISPRRTNVDKFFYMPEVYQMQSPNLFAIDEYWYLSTREADYIVDKETQEMQEFEGDEEDFRHIQFMSNNQFALITKTKQTVNRTIMINDRVLVDEINPYGIDCYPFVFFPCYFNPNTSYYAYKFKGLVRDLRDVQFLFSRRKVSDLDILESQQQGIKIKEGCLVTPTDAQNQGHGRTLVIKKGFQLDDVQYMPIHAPDPTLIAMEDKLKETFRLISGVTEELMGQSVNDKSGILTMLKQGAGLTTLQGPFDRLDESQRQCGSIILKMIQKNYTYNKIKQIIAEEPTQEFENKAFLKYNCKVIQGVLTETQHQLELQQLLTLKEIFGDATPPAINKRIIDAMYIQNKDELKNDIEQYQQSQNEQQQQLQSLQMQQLQIDNETKLAYARSQDGLSQERIAKIQTDRAVAEDKIARAHTEDTASLLNLIRSIKELEDMDLTNVLKNLNVLQKLNLTEFKKETIPSETVEANKNINYNTNNLEG